jgi:hypothetical protein
MTIETLAETEMFTGMKTFMKSKARVRVPL